MTSARTRDKKESAGHPFHKYVLRNVFTILLIAALFACAKKAPPPAAPTTPPPGQETMTPKAAAATPSGPTTEGKVPSRGFWPQGIHIQYTSSPDLNLYESSAHTILVVVYQLSSLNMYNSLAKTTDGLIKLMQAERFDASVVGVDQFFVEPDEKKILTLDRAENAQHVAIVCGYYDMQPGQVNRVFEIPVIVEMKGVYGFRSPVSSIGLLNIPLFMGPNSIQKVSVQ